jgi:hypothetical protein
MDRYIRYGLFYEVIQFAETLIKRPMGRPGNRLFALLATFDDRLLSPLGRANLVAVFQRRPGCACLEKPQ